MADQKDIRSRFVLKFEEEGAAKVKRQVDELGRGLGKDKLAGGMDQLDRSTDRVLRQVAGLGRHIKDVTRTVQQMRRAFEQAAAAAQRVGGGGDGGGGQGRGRFTAGAGRGGAAGSFTQGLLQGVGFGPFIQRGPGAFRQAAGVGVGRFAGSAAQVPFSGISGLAQGLASIPGGGLVGSALQTAVGTAGSQLQFQQALLGFGGPDAVTRRARARRAALVRAAESRARTRAEAISAREREQALESGLGPDPALDPLLTTTRTSGVSGEDLRREAARGRVRSGEGSREESLVTQARRAASADARRRFGDDPVSRFERATRELTVLTRTQALQFATRAGLSGQDPSFATAARGGGLSAALAAQTVGVGDAANLGAFLRAERRGGIVGAGEPGGGIADVVEGAFAAGFDRSEATRFLAQIASSQQNFERTGIPINPGSVLGIARGVTGAFGAGARSAAVAQGVTAAAQRVGQQGPRTPEEFLLLQSLGGFRGGGLRGLEEAQLRLERGEFGRDQLLDFIRRTSSAAGGGEAGRFAIRGGLGRLGVQTGIEETRRLQTLAEGGQLTRKQREFVDAQLSQLRRTPADAQSALAARARGVVGAVGGLAGARDLEDQRVGIGRDLLPVVQRFEKATLTTASSIGRLAPTLSAIGDSAQAIARYLPQFAEWIQSVVGTGPGVPNVSGQ